MATKLTDTHPEAEAKQIELLRKSTTSERFSLVCSLTKTALFHAKRAIARANPELSQRERDLLFVEVHYGKDLAAGLREYLEASSQ